MGKKRRKRMQKKQKSDEITLDMDGFKEKSDAFIKKAEKIGKNKYIHYAWIALLIIILIIISSYVRLGTLNLAGIDEGSERSVEDYFKRQIEQEVRAERPNLPDRSIQALVEERYQEDYEENKEQIQQEAQRLADNTKSQLQNDDGMTYLLGIDEYLFYSYAKWYNRTGFMGTEIVDGEPRFMLRDGRFGRGEEFRFHSRTIYALYKIWNPINPNFNIEWASFYIQVVLMGLGAIPLFFLGRRIGGTTGGFIAAALVLVATPLVGRTMGGSSDDDVHTVIYTFAMMALLFGAIGKKTKVIAIMAALAGLVNAIFMLGWSGWWYGFLLVAGSAGLYLVYEFVRKKLEGKNLTLKEWINNSTFLVVFFISAIVFAMIVASMTGGSPSESASRVISAPYEPLQLVARLGAGADVRVAEGQYPLWPNVLRTVAELNPASFNQIINGAGVLTENLFLTSVIMILIFVVAIFLLAKHSKSGDFDNYKVLGVLIGAALYFINFYAGSGIINVRKEIFLYGLIFVLMISNYVYNYLKNIKKSEFQDFGLVLLLWSVLLIDILSFSSPYRYFLFFDLAGLGILSLFFRHRENPNFTFYGMVLVVWISGMIFIAMDAVRFILMAAIPILLSVSALLGAIFGPVSSYVSKTLDIRKSLVVGLLSVFFVFVLLLGPVSDARKVSAGNVPIFDDAWYDSIYNLKEDADQYDKRAIISSWWDYGHFFQAYSEHTVTFDGGDQGKRIYWMGRTLLTSDVEEAHNILKVMNCGQEYPYDLLEEYMGERYRPTQIKLAITQMSREEARVYMEEEGLPDHLIEEVLGLTHCDDLHPMYLVTSADMVDKAGVWGHFGGWDFTKAYFYYYLRHLPLTEVYDLAEKNLNLSEEEVRNMYDTANNFESENQAVRWISPNPGFGGRDKARCNEDNRTLLCDFNTVIQQDGENLLVLRRAIVSLDDLDETELILQLVNRATGSPSGNPFTVTPAGIVIERDGEFEDHRFSDVELGFDLVLMDEGARFTSILASPELSRSVFARLFFMEGRGSDLDMFEKISDITSFRNERIIIWKVHP